MDEQPSSSDNRPRRSRGPLLIVGLLLVATVVVLLVAPRENHQQLFQRAMITAAADPAAGEQLLEAAIERAESRVYPDAEIARARLLIQRGDFTRVRASFDHIDLAACDPELAIAFARVATKADLTEMAVQTLEALAARDIPQREAALEALRDHYMEWGQDDLAVATAQRLARTSPDNPRHWLRLVETLARLSRHNECVAAAREGIARDLPREVKQDLRNVLIEALINLGEIEGIEKELAELSRSEPDSLRVRGHQVYLRRLKGESAAALELLGKIMDGGAASSFRSSPPEVRAHAHFTRGILNIDLRQFDEAIRDLERVIELQPANSAARFKLSEAYRAVKRDDDAARQRVEATRIVEQRKRVTELLRQRAARPRDPAVYRELAQVHEQAGDAAGAAHWRSWAERVTKAP